MVRTIDENGSEISFSLKPTTPLGNLMQAYCNRQGMDMKNLRFMYDGKRIEGAQTPADIDMEDGDTIDVQVVL